MTALTNPEIKRLRLTKNLPGLIKELRCQRDPEHRQQAALGLYELDDEGVISWLLQSILYDPDPYVRRGVRAIMRDRLGDDLELALQVQASGGVPAGAWLVDAHPEKEEVTQAEDPWHEDDIDLEDAEEAREDYGWFEPSDKIGDRIDISDDHLTLQEMEEIRGLVMVATGDGNPELRKRAVLVLGQYSHLEVIEVLASVAVTDEHPEVHQAARQILAERFGGDLPAVLESLGLVEDDSDEDDLEPDVLTRHDRSDQFSFHQPGRKSELFAQSSQMPVVQEEKTLSPAWLLLMLGVGLIGFLYVTGILKF